VVTINTRYWDYNRRHIQALNNAHQACTDVIMIDNTTGEHVQLSDLPERIHNWIARNPKFILSGSSDSSIARQVISFMAEKGRATQRSPGFPNLIMGPELNRDPTSAGGKTGRANLAAGRAANAVLEWFTDKDGVFRTKYRLSDKTQPNGKRKYIHITLGIEKSVLASQVNRRARTAESLEQ
jgi:hypothetical protein